MSVRKEKDLQKYILMLINKPEDERSIDKAFSKLGLPIVLRFRGHGTANSEILDICGLDGTLRLISLCLVNKDALQGVLQKLESGLRLRRRGHGIAAVLRVTGLQDTIKRIVDEEEKQLASEKGDMSMEGTKTNTHSMIFVAADQGYSEDIIEAARSAGARGGTVIRGRRSGTEGVMTLLGMSTQEEQEFTMIIVEKSLRAAVMEAISSACGLKTPAHGIVLSLPVEEAIGLE